MDNPDPVRENRSSEDNDYSSSCVFCNIAKAFQPVSPKDDNNPLFDPDKLSPPTYIILATEHVVAFLDIAPLTRGHVLVAPRQHRVKMGDLTSRESAEVGRVLPLITRSVLKSVLPDISHEEVDYNVVQNNGPGAAQVIPHVHFHIVPRPPFDYKPPASNPSSRNRYEQAKVPTGLKASYIQFGRGARNELDDDDAVELVKVMRANIKDEWEREFSDDQAHSRLDEGRKGMSKPYKL